MPNRLTKFFVSDHLPPELREVSQLFERMAHFLDGGFDETAEKTAGMRKLLEAKDCFVRAKLEALAEKDA